MNNTYIDIKDYKLSINWIIILLDKIWIWTYSIDTLLMSIPKNECTMSQFNLNALFELCFND